MPLAIEAEPAPLRVDEHGAIRVGQCRVLFELVIRAFQDGATPEQIVEMYPTLALADTYGAVAYYLRHSEAVHEYLEDCERKALEIRAKIEAAQPDMEEKWRRLVERSEAAGGLPPAPPQ